MKRYTDEHGGINVPRVLFDAGIGIFLVILLVLMWPLHSVPTGFRGVITVGGKISGIEPEGYLLLWPWQRLDNFSIRAEEANIEKAEGATSDQQPVHVSLTVRYAIRPEKVASVFEQYSHTGNLASFVQTATQEVFKAVTAKFTAPDLIAKRAIVSQEIRDALQAKLDIYGALVINIDMRNFAFSDSYMQAINDKVTQEQKRLAAENAAKTEEAKQKIKVVTAEADAHALKVKADAEAYQVLAAARAEAESTRINGAAKASAMKAQAEALASNKELVQYTIAQKWDGALPTWLGTGPMPLLSIKDYPKHAGIRADAAKAEQ